MPNETIGDLNAARAEVQSLARRATENGCSWAAGDLQTYFDEIVTTQRVDSGLLPQVLAFWRERFASAAADPGQRRPAYLSLIEARETLRSAESRLRNLSLRDPQRFRGLLERLEAATDDRERALLLLSAEGAAAMLPPGLRLNEAPTPPFREAAALLRSLRASGIGLSLNGDGQIEIHGVLSESQRQRLRELKPEIVGLLNQPTEIV